MLADFEIPTFSKWYEALILINSFKASNFIQNFGAFKNGIKVFQKKRASYHFNSLKISIIPFLDRDGETALRLAAEYKYESMIKLLIQHGSNLYLPNNDGKTAFSTLQEDSKLFSKFENLIKATNSEIRSIYTSPGRRRKSII